MDPRKVGFCEFIYQDDDMCDQLSDPKAGGNNDLGDSGSVYGAYAIPRCTTPTPTGVRIVYTVSVHNPVYWDAIGTFVRATVSRTV
jgi:hypothetical protein